MAGATASFPDVLSLARFGLTVAKGTAMQLLGELERTRDETLGYCSLDQRDLERTHDWATGLDYAQRPLALSARVYESARNAIIYYAGTSYEQQGHLEWVHSVMGVRTLKDEFDKVASHNEHHLSQIRFALQSGS
jgi:hypothetical protein